MLGSNLEINVGQGDIIKHRLILQQLLVSPNQGRKALRNLGRGLNVLGKGHRALHGVGVFIKSTLLSLQLTRALGQAIPRTNHRGGEREVDLIVFAMGHGVGSHGFIDGHDQDLVIRKQALIHGLAKAQPVELGAINTLIVHRGQLSRVLGGLAFHGVIEKPRRCSHVQTLGSLDVVRIVHAHEVAGVLAGQGDAGGAVGLIANDEVKLI